MSVRKRTSKNGKITYQAVIERGFDSTGKRIRDTKTFPTKREAEIYLATNKTAIINGTYIEPSKMSVSEALDEWLLTEVNPRLSVTTIDGYERNVNKYIRPALGKIPLQKLTPTAVQNFYNTLDKVNQLSERSIKYIHDNLHNFLKHFVISQVVQRNVCDFVKVPKKDDKQEHNFYSEDEVKLLFNAVKDERLRVVILLGMLGLRRSEMCALTWADVDMGKNKITINKNLTKVKGKFHIGHCKTKSSQRTIPVPETTMKMLAEYKRYQIKERQYCIGEYVDRNLLVCKINGDFYVPATLSADFPKLLRKHKLREIRLHDLRHTYCSLALNYFNIPPTTVAKNVGHSSTKVTMDTYSHSNEELQKQSADVFEERLYGDLKAN